MTGRQEQRGKGRRVSGSGEPEGVSTITPRFKLIFITVTGFTVSFFASSLLMTLLISSPSAEARDLMDNFMRLATAGFGAIIGLLGGKAA